VDAAAHRMKRQDAASTKMRLSQRHSIHSPTYRCGDISDNAIGMPLITYYTIVTPRRRAGKFWNSIELISSDHKYKNVTIQGGILCLKFGVPPLGGAFECAH